MNIKKYLIYFILFLSSASFIVIYGCKKIDLVRVAAVNTESMDNITSSSAKAFASIVDLGIEEQVEDYGFCWSSINSSPTTSDSYYYFGISTNYFRNYDYIIYGLQSSTIYYLRAFVKADGNISFGNTIKFETQTGTPSGTWFNYDDGTFYTGIGRTGGGGFDLAIRIPTSDLQDFNGFYVSKFKFYVTEGNPVEYAVTVWEGSDTPDLIYYEDVQSYNVDAWTEYSPSQQYVINSSNELWVGLWVQNHLADTYPAGVDDGPAVVGKGDMISFDDGGEWSTLSSGGLDYNWNLQVYVTNYKGVEKQITLGNTTNYERVKSNKNEGLNTAVAKKQNSNLYR